VARHYITALRQQLLTSVSVTCHLMYRRRDASVGTSAIWAHGATLNLAFSPVWYVSFDSSSSHFLFCLRNNTFGPFLVTVRARVKWAVPTGRQDERKFFRLVTNSSRLLSLT
jgi:hypothetical protein